MRILACLMCICLFGSGAFAQSPYRLVAGDTIEVAVLQEPGLGRQVLVAPDGQVSFPLVGRLRAAGLTLGAFETALKRRLDAYYKEPLDVTVLLVKVDEQKTYPTIYVTGEVVKPGAFEVKSRTTVLQALALSGGVSPFAAKRRILVRRHVDGQELVFPFDYSAVEKGLPIIGDIQLRHGDVIVVPERGLFE